MLSVLPTGKQLDSPTASDFSTGLFLTTAPVDTSISDAVLSQDAKHNVVLSDYNHDKPMLPSCTISPFLPTPLVNTSLSDADSSYDAKHNNKHHHRSWFEPSRPVQRLHFSTIK